MKKINLLFGIHCHQPLGNLPNIFEDSYRQAYLPFIKTMEKHPQIKFTFHYSGVLYEWFKMNHPEFLNKLMELVKRGQAEALTGGFYEPILPLIPDRDKLGQINLESEFIRKELKTSPRGLWLTERIWEPHIAKSLNQAGIEYVALDDYHFLCAGVRPEDVFGYYITEEEGFPIAVFPISKDLRYRIPFRPPNESIDYLKEIATEDGMRAAIIVDDGEKFGVWPGTHKWVYDEGYLENLLLLLEKNAQWIIPMTLSEYLDSFPPLGKIYLPAASYFEMMEWSLPTNAALKLEKILSEIKNKGKDKEFSQFFKGGFFRNFLVKYPEANNMYSKMLMLSSRIASLRKGKSLDLETAREKKISEAEQELWKGQCNCAYWHGLFGGLYLNYLRDAVYEHLIKGETILDKLKHPGKFIDLVVTDFDKDAKEEIVVSNDLLNLYLSPEYGGSLFELDYKPKCYNLLNTLTRREEVYHKKIKEAEPGQNSETLKGIISIHDLLKAKAKGLEDHLVYDTWRKVSLLDHFLSNDSNLHKFKDCRHKEIGDFVGKPYKIFVKRSGNEINITLYRTAEVEHGGEKNKVKLTKSITIFSGQSIISILYELENRSSRDLDLWFGTEFNLSMENKLSKNIDEITNISNIKIIDELSGISVLLDMQKSGDFWRFPIETVSQSESGFEKRYQQSTLFPNWRFKLNPGESWKNKIILSIEES